MSFNTDLWHHYGRTRAERNRTVPDAFYWIWSQDRGPGPEALGDLAGRVVGDLGAGAAWHAAHLAVHHEPKRIDAVDASPAQSEMAVNLFGHIAPRLRIVPNEAVDHLRSMPGTYDVLYSVFGALDFTDPRKLLPAVASALRPGGRLVFSTLAHYLSGAPAQADVVPADIQTKRPDGRAATMRRWVLQEHVWEKVLDETGFTRINVDVLPASTMGMRTVDTFLITAYRTAPSGQDG